MIWGMLSMQVWIHSSVYDLCKILTWRALGDSTSLVKDARLQP